MNTADAFTLLQVLDPQPGDGDLNLIDLLRRLQTALSTEADTDMLSPDPAHQTAIAAVLDHLDPSNGSSTFYADQLQWLRVLVDSELSRWVSARVQPLGPSGQVALSEV
jgi:hypothetical protein